MKGLNVFHFETRHSRQTLEVPNKIKMKAALLLLFTLIPGPLVNASEEVNENPLKATAIISPNKIPPGANGSLKVDLEIAPHHKAYLDMFKLKWVGPENVKVGTFKITPTFKFEDKFSKKQREAVKGLAQLVAPVEFPEDFKEGSLKAQIELTYQACSEEYCLFPKTIKLDTETFKVAHFESQKPRTPSSNASIATFEGALERGLFFTFFFVFLAGVATSLTPCIFPMIPITLAVIGAKSTGQTKLRSFTLSLSYVFGIAITYAILGVVAARTGALFGSALGNPYVVGAIAFLFVLMGLSMYGVFELKIPAIIGDRLTSTKTEKGFKGAFITGLIAGVVASPCVGPVLVSVLTYVAQTQNLVLGFFLLFTFALGLGQLFLVLGTFSSLTQKLPRSGGWMDGVKFFFGTTMIAMALYYLHPVTSPRLFSALVAIALILISGAFGAFESNSQLVTVAARMKKAVMLAFFVIGIGFTLKAVFGDTLFSSPMMVQQNGKGESFAKLDWKEYSDAALEKAKQDRSPVIIDFWADWCAACKELEILTFTDPRIQTESKKFTLLKVNATNDSEEIQRLKKIYRVVGLPTMIFITPDGEIQWENTLTGFENADAFLERIGKALGKNREIGSTN